MSKVAQRRRREPAPQAFFTRRASVPASSYNAATGTFAAVIATETPVLRRSFDGDYLEVLSIKPGAVRLGRLQSGAAPLLDSHRANSARDQIGIVAGARIENAQLVIDARLSARDDVKPIASDLAGGTPPNVSVGYRVYASAESRTPEGMLVITRTDWEPFEASFVPIPADPKTHVRKGNSMDPDELETETHTEIETRAQRADGIDDDPPAHTMSDRHAREAYTIAARAGLPADFACKHIDNGGTLKEFRTIVINRQADEADRTKSISNRSGDGGETLDNPDFLGRAIENALYARMAGKAPAGPATELMGRSALEMGTMLLEARGEKVTWANRDRLAEQVMTRHAGWGAAGGYHTTSDFPTLLLGAGNRVMLDAYKAAECPLKALAVRRDAADFRPTTMVKISDAPELLEVLESGEIKYGSRSEAKEGFRLKTYARIFSISRNALINDDLNAFADSSRAWGRSSAELEAKLIVSLFTANSGDGADLDDGDPLYTTARGNKAASGAVIGEAGFTEARKAMREMKGLDGVTPVSITPRHLVVGAAKETEAEKMLAAIAAAKTSDVNPFAGKITLHIEPRFSGNAWRLFADPSEIPTVVIGYLNGAAGPSLATLEGWTTLGTEFRATLDFGCGLADWRGTYLNPGN